MPEVTFGFILVTMPPPQSLVQLQDPNKHGCLPPLGCILPSRSSGDPSVATGEHTAGPFEYVLLIENKTFKEVFAEVIIGSATLKAWFAFRLKIEAPRGSHVKLSRWSTVWSAITANFDQWSMQYPVGHQFPATQWELQMPQDIPEMHAMSLFMLYRAVAPNEAGNRLHGISPKWHPYYYEDEGKFFLLHRLLCFLNSQTSGTRSMTIFGRLRNNTGYTQEWLESAGGRIALACQKFMEGSSFHGATDASYQSLY